jgi:hypothetical protein
MRFEIYLVCFALLLVASCNTKDSAMNSELDYDDMVILDAESLAEGGISEAYESLLPKLRQFVARPASIEEDIDDGAPSYTVRCGGSEFAIYGPELVDEEGESWGRATYAFFAIVNDQLAGSEHRFFAINGGNDLGGMFLTQAAAEAARKQLPRKNDWPYLPNDQHPWYGQHH